MNVGVHVCAEENVDIEARVQQTADTRKNTATLPSCIAPRKSVRRPRKTRILLLKQNEKGAINLPKHSRTHLDESSVADSGAEN